MPESPVVTQIILWGAPTLFLATLWFVARFVNQHDEFHKKVNERFDSIASDMAKTGTKIADGAEAIAKTSLELKTASLDFQTRMNDHMLEIHRHAVRVNSEVQGILAASEDSRKRILALEKDAEAQKVMVTKVFEIAKNVFRVTEEEKKKKP